MDRGLNRQPDEAVAAGSPRLAAGLPAVVGALAALAMTTVGEALQVTDEQTAALGAFASSLPLTAHALRYPLLCEALRALAAFIGRGRLRLAIECVAAGAEATWTYLVLAEYAPFAGWLTIAGAAVLGLGLAALGASAFSVLAPTRVRVALALAGLVAGAAMTYVNYTALPDAYPTLHHALLGLTLCVNGRAVALLTDALPLRASKLVLIGLLGVFGVATALELGSAEQPAYRAARTLTLSGQAGVIAAKRAIAAAHGKIEDPCRAAPAPLTDEEALQDLTRYTALANVPPSWGGRFNLLLVTVEALRASDVNLSGGDTLMPRTRSLFEKDAVLYDRGYSPTPTTVQTMAALQALAPVSHTALQVEGDRAWRGHLRDGAGTFIEALERDGYATWAAVHPGGFSGNWRAPARGIARMRADGDAHDPTIDVKIVDDAISLIEQTEPNRPWFGWVYLLTPHAPYDGRGKLTEADSPHDRYRSEVTYTDEQLGRLFDRLAALGQLDRTLILVTGDHGEAFGEHGTIYHSSHLYEESVRVPLAVHWPGIANQRVPVPVITTEVLAAVLASGPPQAAAFARGAARDHLMPMRRAAGGAAVVELLSIARMWVGLVGERHKLVALRTFDTTELFDVSADPAERVNLFDRDAGLKTLWGGRLRDVLALRACKANYLMTFPTKP